MKKIAIITKNTTFNKYFGGLEIHTKLLIDRLSELGFEIHIFAPIRELKNDAISDGNKKYFFVDANYKTGLFSDLLSKNWNKKLLTFFNKKHLENNYDLVLSISSAGYPIINHKKDYNFKILTVSHGSAISEFSSIFNESGFSFSLIKNLPYVLYNYIWKQRNFINNSDLVIAVSNYVRNSLISETGIDEQKIFVIHNGARIENFTKEFRENGPVKLIFAGRVEKSKGIFILLESIKDLDVSLVVCGGGTALEKAKKLSRDLRIENKVKFLGKLDSLELVKEYKNADVLIAPSLRVEGFPMSIIEGMSYFLPVIASSIGGNSDAVFEGRNGFLVDVTDSKELRERIRFFTTYPEKIKQFGMNSRNLAEQKFNLDIMIEEYTKKINEFIR
jgi:glycosyltransferase involved in cell wall biosynthesis